MTYVYCLVRSSRKPGLRRAAGGLPGAGRPRALDAGRGLWLIVADVDDARYGEAAIARGLKNLDWVSRRAVAHEAVVERFLSAPALLPMQLLTIFTSDDRALAHVARDRRRIERILRRVAGHVEWGLRLTWDERAARAAVEGTHRRRGRTAATADGQGQVGTAYLARKRDLLDVRRRQLANARAQATRLHRSLGRLARDAVRRTHLEKAAPGSRLLLDAAYLVAATRNAAFRAAVRRETREFDAAGISTALTGPWPPYNFIAS